MTFSSHLACIKNKALQLKDQVQLIKLLIIRKDVATMIRWGPKLIPGPSYSSLVLLLV